MTIVVTVVAVAVFLLTPPEWQWPTDRFEPGSWQSTPDNERFRFARSLIDGDALIGKSSQQVFALLGHPSYLSPDSRYMTYVIKDNVDEWFALPALFILQIDFEQGKVVRAFIRSE